MSINSPHPMYITTLMECRVSRFGDCHTTRQKLASIFGVSVDKIRRDEKSLERAMLNMLGFDY